LNAMLCLACGSAAASFAVVGCGGDPPPGCPEGTICVDSGPGGGGDAGDAGPRPDTGMVPDGGNEGCRARPGLDNGAACSMTGVCLAPMECQEEVAGNFTMTKNQDNTAGPPLPLRVFPGTMCAEMCDMDAPEDECGECATCESGALAGRVRFLAGADETEAFCRRDCEITPTDPRGGCREGYQCDPGTNLCMEACSNDDQCRFFIADPDGDGDGDITYGGADYPATCDVTSGRCRVMGNPAGVAGSPCEEDLDCYDDGFCLDSDDPASPLADGFCTRLYCGAGNPCGTGEVCSLNLFSDASACLPGCTIGGETTDAERAGTAGRNPDCDPGQACFWDGTSGPDADPNGGCFAANYNDETAYNVGGACLDDADCYSPFGYGRCLFTAPESLARVQSGFCAVSSCAGGAPGEPITLMPGVEIPADWQPRVCDTAGGDICVNFGSPEDPATFCVQGCTSGNECAPGYACPALLSEGGRVCWPNCQATADCHTGATCQNTTGGACGEMDECYCSDAMPAPIDAGMPAADGGAGAADAGVEADAG
jgi:hypothetical protein